MPVPPPAHATRVFQGVINDIWQWEQEMFDGSRKTFECAMRDDAVTVIPFLDADTVLIAHEEQPGRPAFQGMPGGRMDEGETAEEAARRELIEETGYTAGTLQLFRSVDYFGAVRMTKHIFLAKNLTNTGSANPEMDGERIVTKPIAWKELVSLALQNKLRVQETMLAIASLEFDPESRAMKERFLAS